MKSSPDQRFSKASPPKGGDAFEKVGNNDGNGLKYAVAAAAAGLVNGLFGGGGGIPLLVLLTRWAGLEEKKAFATCVAVIFPLCIVSAVIFYWHGGFSLTAALPYLAGGLIGGFAGGSLFADIPKQWLRRVFALFLLYGSYRYLFS